MGTSGYSAAAVYLTCNVCDQRVPLTPVRQQFKSHRNPATDRTCVGSGVRPPPSSAGPRQQLSARLKPWTKVATWTIKGIAGAFAILGAIAAAVEIRAGISEDSNLPDRPMHGTMNIAVSDFVVAGDASRDEVRDGEAFAAALHDSLQATTCADHPNGTTQCRGPQDVPLVDGASPAEQGRLAAEIAADINADILVYGRVESHRGQVTAHPAVYIDVDQLPRLEELAGTHELISTTGYVSTGREAQNAVDDLHRRVDNIATVMFAANAYNLDDADQADRFLADITAGDGDTDWGFDQHLFEFVIANVRLRQGSYEEALEHYDMSLRFYGDLTGDLYSRAAIGRAETTYHQLRSRASPTGDCLAADPNARADLVNGLEATIQDFTAGRSAAADEGATVVVRKADYGIGRVQTCLARAGVPAYWERAEATFTGLVDDLESSAASDEGLSAADEEVLADSHSFLGFVAWQRTDSDRSPTSLHRAADEYRTAARITHHPEREELYLDYAAAIDEEIANAPASTGPTTP